MSSAEILSLKGAMAVPARPLAILATISSSDFVVRVRSGPTLPRPSRPWQASHPFARYRRFPSSSTSAWTAPGPPAVPTHTRPAAPTRMMSDIRALRSPPLPGAGGAPPGLGLRGDSFRRPPETVKREPGACRARRGAGARDSTSVNRARQGEVPLCLGCVRRSVSPRCATRNGLTYRGDDRLGSLAASSTPRPRGSAGSRVEAAGRRMSTAQGSARPLAEVRIETLSTRGGRPPGAHEVGVHVRYGEFFTFLGPPKSGKSDVLRAIAGFLPMTSGRVLVDGQDISLLPRRGRGVGYVFQEGALWPHLTVAQHIAFGLEQQGLAAAEIARKVATVVGRLGLAGLEARRPPELGIEQRRRLAIARALAVEPRVLLLDEPLANIDPAARKTLRLDLTKLHRDLAVTTIHATRNAADALALSDRLAVMGEGRLLQVGDPDELYRGPSSRAVAETLGPANFLRVSVVEVRDLGVVVETEGGHQVPVAGTGAFRKGDRGLLVLRPRHSHSPRRRWRA